MANHKYFDRICIIICVVTIVIALVYSYWGRTLGVTQNTADLSYTTTLFDDSSVHTINIQIDENAWNDLQENASDEEYQQCAVTIDGETIQNVAIRAKGNSSLSSVTASDSERYSFKVDFNKYNDGTTYHGLDKLNLNNLIQDNTYLKDYLCYDMMRYMGVAAPLTSFTRISINGEYFGLYLAVEGVEQAFAARNYGSDTGNIYKPESSEIGGDMGDGIQAMGGGGDMPDLFQKPDGVQQSDTQSPDADGNGQTQMPDMTQMQNMAGGGDMGGDSGNDVALIYSDDQTSSYNHIWDGAVFDITSSDQTTLIDSIKQLNEGENLDQIIDVDEVLKYFVVHSFVDNYDSYTGSMKHNYYLREDDGKLSIIAWDYNLAFNTFMGGGGMGGDATTTTTSTMDDATLLVNYPIDTPVYGTTMSERPLLNALLSNETYLKLYHQYYEEFISGYFDSGRCDETIDSAAALISSAVETDPTAFCTYQEYQDGVAVLKQFCALRAESISGQLDGTIPATTDGQTVSSATLIDASTIDLTAMGSSMSGGNGMNTNAGLTMPTAVATTGQTATVSDGATGIENTANQATAGNAQKPANGGQPPNANMTGNNTANAPSGGPGGQAATSDTSSTQTTADANSGQTAPNGTAAATNTTDSSKATLPDMQNGMNSKESSGLSLSQNLPALILLGSSLLLLGGGLLMTKLFRRKI